VSALVSGASGRIAMSRTRASKRVSLAVAALALVAGPSLIARPAFAATTPNLLKNPEAEAGKGSTDGSVVPVPGWIETNGVTFTAVKYGATGGFPTAASPGPTSRGKNFFAGGPGDENNSIVASQTVKLKAFSTPIKQGGVKYVLKGFLGGMGEENDQALVEIDFRDKDGFFLDSALLPAVTATDRNGTTGLLKRSVTGLVPAAARTITVQLILDRIDGTYNNAYADDLSLTLKGV
jgi:hypothetical protein